MDSFETSKLAIMTHVLDKATPPNVSQIILTGNQE